MAKRKKSTRKLPHRHSWKARPGNSIFVADRGAMQFEYPSDWICEPQEGGSIRFFDREEADADIRLEVSLIYVPPIDWSGLSLVQLLEDTVVSQDTRGLTWREPYQEMKRATLEAAWLEVGFTDSEEHRAACSRLCMARGPGAYGFITMEFWTDDADGARGVWDVVLETLKLNGQNRGRLTMSGSTRVLRPGQN